MSHDQNFKNLILDYPRAALQFFASAEADAVDAGARILPVREEQQQERLGERFRELDVPLLVEWPDGRREAALGGRRSGSATPACQGRRCSMISPGCAEFHDRAMGDCPLGICLTR